MTARDLPLPPAFTALEAWAGSGRVIRAAESDLADWRLLQRQKASLVSAGVPLLEGVVDVVSFTAEPTGYRLAGRGLDPSRPDATYAAEPETGQVLERAAGGGRLVNSSIDHWLCSLHLVGTWLAGSTAIHHWDEDPTTEERALAELADLGERIARLDPSARGGDHRTHFWPAVLDRWLY
ncbi:SUKH-4 family immunity protein [Actinosynnema sp. NPDC023794]